jgi:hypothetical protein
VSDGLYDIIYYVYAQRDGNHQTHQTKYLIITYRISHLIRRFFSRSEVYSQIALHRNTGKC